MSSVLEQFLTFAAPSSMKALQEYRDNETMRSDLSRFQVDPMYRINPAQYRIPENAVKMEGHLKDQRNTRLQEQASPLLEKFAVDYENLAGPDKRFYADPESRQVLQQSGLQAPAGDNPYVRKGLADFAKQGQLENDFADIVGGTATPGTYGRVAANPTAQAQHNILSTLQVSQDKGESRAAAAEKEARALQGKQNLSDFQAAIGGLTAPAQSFTDIARFAKRGGYDTFPGVESDIRQAASAYGVGDSDEVNKAVSAARDFYKEQKLPTEQGKVGRTSYTGQRNLLENFQKDVGSTAPVVKVNLPNPRADRKDEFALRKEFLSLPEVKDFPTIESNAKRAAAALNATGSKLAVDQSLITVFNKMIDPSSVVRESEYARTPQDMAVLNRIKGNWGKIQEGGAGLPIEERQALARMITNFSRIASQQYNARAGEYRKLANDYGFEPSRVVARGNGVSEDRPIAPAGIKARVNGKILTSDGKGGWK